MIPALRILVPVLLLVLLAPLLAAGADAPEEPEWDELADVETVRVITSSDDGTKLYTTVWLAVVDEQGYIRTGGSRWGKNVRRDPQVGLQVGESEYELFARFVEDEELYQRITDVFREKYGFVDRMMSLFRGDRPTIMRLTSR